MRKLHADVTLSKVVAVASLFVGAALALGAMGRVVWCEGGQAQLFSADIWSMHNSQHLADPYTLTHVLHGVAFYGLLWLIVGTRLSHAGRFVVTLGVETVWEVFENTPYMIDRYRESTISLDYYGDSIVNSLADIAACGIGYALAAAIPTWASVGGFFAIEALLILWIRDSLLLNILMLIRPLDAVRNWQLPGG